LKPTPAEERVSTATSPRGGRFSPGGLVEFLSFFSHREALEEFLKWRGHPATVRFLGALRAMAANVPPAYLNRDSVELQYGVTSGLGLAVTLIDDPTSLYPELFTKEGSTPGPGGAPEPEASYMVAPDA
jgi:hypothetical protein